MQNTGKSRKTLIIGVVAAVVILAVVLVLLLTQCTGGTGTATTAPSTTAGADEVPTYELYWNADRALYDGKSEAGMSSRMPEADGYFHVRFILDGEEVILKVADRKVINAIDIQSLMGLEFDEDGIVIGAIAVEDMPLEKVAWQFYVQSAGGKTIKANSSSSMNGMEVLLEGNENTGVYDMSGKEGPLGTKVTPISQDRIYAVQNLAGELTHVFIYERPGYMLSFEAECEHCGKTVTWYEWNKENELPITSGHFQLQGNITTKKQSSMEEEAKICLDLNGFRVDGASGARVYSLHNVGAELALMDTSEAKTGTLAAHGKGDQGMVVWLRYGQFHLYDGILDASDAATTKNGTAVALQANTYMYMYGGEIIGGTSTYTYNESTKAYGNALGGTMALNSKSKFVMNDGVIRDGFAESKITAWNTDGSPKTYQRGLGGNIFMSSGSVMELNGGVIKNGKAGSTGGNIYMDGTSELTINGGSIQGGRGMGKGKNGGSLFISSKATVYLKSGRITGGTSYNCGGNVYLNGTLSMSGGYIGGGVIRNFSTGKVNEDAAHRNLFIVNGTFRMYGGSIDGGVQATDSSATDNKRTFVGLTTYATIDGGEKSNNNLTLSLGAGGPVQVNVGDLRDSAKIRVKAYTGIFTTPTNEKNVDNFVSDIESADILYHQGCIALGRMSCICGKDAHFGACDGTEQLWAPHNSTTGMPNRDGYFYLDSDVKMSSTTYLQNEQSSVHTRVDLNGKTVTGPNGKSARVYSLFEVKETYDADGNVKPNIENVAMQLTVTDTVGTGKIVLSQNDDRDQGAMFWGRFEDSVLNFYGGTFDGSASASARHQGVVISTAGDLNIYGGTFTGGSATAGAIVSMSKSGGVFTMTGGTITGGVATGTNGGGNVYLAGGTTFNMEGGTIENGTGRNGGNIYMAAGASMNLSGGTITGGRVDNSALDIDGGIGGNIYQNGTFTMTGGVISDGYVRGGKKGGGHGGNLGYYGQVQLLGGVIRDGEAASAGGNVATIATGASIVMDGVRLENGKAGGNGGNFAVHVRNAKSVEIKGNTVITGGTANGGGNIALRGGTASAVDMTATISDITISDGTATSYGGNIYVYNNTADSKAFRTDLVLKNVTLENGSSGSQGGNIFFEGRGQLTIEDSKLIGGTARQGGNLFVYGGQGAVLKNSEITKGVAFKSGDSANGGNIYIANKCQMQLVDTTVSDGTVRGNTSGKYPTGGNIYMASSAHLTLEGETLVIGGKTDQQVASWAAGGNVYLSGGTLDINGAAVTAGDVEGKGSVQGNNIYICSAATVNLNDGKIENTATGSQSIYMEGGALNIKGGQIINTADNSRNIVSKANVNGVVNMSGGEICGGHTNADGGANVYIPSSFEFNLSGGTIRDGVTDTASGGNVQVGDGGVLNITGGEIKDGEAGNTAGNIIITGTGVVNMSGGTISGGRNLKSGANGGSINIAAGATFDMSGGTVKDGSTANIGGNFYNAGTLNISGDAYITGGTKNGAANSSGNIANVNGTLNLSGGVIDGDVGATNSGRNGVTITMSDKVIINKGKVGGLYLSRFNYDYPAAITLNGLLAEGSHIVIDCVSETVITANATVEENLQFFEPLKAERDLVWVTMDKDIDGDGTNDLHKLSFGLTYCICGSDSDDPADHLGDCGGELLTWLPWTKTDSLPTTTGNWYLTGNVTLNSEKTIDTSEDINIDLNGYSVTTAKNLRFFRVRNADQATTVNIAVTDTSEAKTGRIDHNCAASTVDGAIVWLTQAGHTFSLYGGTLDASDVISNTYATAIKLNNGVANIYGGAVIGGATTDASQNGVAIRINAPATMNITGGTLTGGIGGNQGGLVAVYGELNISGGTFVPGDVKQGDCIAVIKDAASSPAKLTISDCELPGDVYLNQYAGACDVTLTGKVTVNKGNQYGLYSTGVDEIGLDVSGLTEGSNISINACGYFAEGANETIATYFKPELDGGVILDGDKLLLGRKSCLCGKVGGSCISTVCDGTELVWKPWRSTSTLPTESGNWYLTGTTNVTASVAAVKDQNVVLDLNGQTVNRSGRLLSTNKISNTAYTITDTSAAQSGTIKLTGTSTNQGGIWFSGTDTKLTLVRGTIDGSGRKLTANSGVVIAVSSGNSFDMHGGKIIGGTCEAAEGKSSMGGAVSSAGTTNIYGGTITGGSSTQNGGNIRISGGTFTVHGGEITNGVAENGGNITISAGKLIVKGGVISGGKASAYGGNIHQTGGTVELLGGTVENGSVTSSDAESGGGNLAASAASGVLKLNDVTVKNGTASHRGGNIYLYENGIDMTIAGNTAISGGTANYGANICLNAEARSAADRAVVTMNDGKISGGNARANAAGVYIYENYEFILNDGAIENGIAKGDGGNVFMSNYSTTGGVFTMNGGSITGGEAGKDNANGRNGGNVYVAANTTFNLNGGTVSGGTSNNSGGNIHVIGTMKMTDGTVSGGSAKNASSVNIAVQGGTLEMSGGKVEGNVTVVNSSATMDSKIIFSGEPVISGGTLGLKLAKVSPATVAPMISVKGTLGGKADILISNEVSDGVIGDATAGASAKAFKAQNPAKDVVKLDDATLYLGKYGCICGGISGTDCAKAGHPKVKWTLWTSTNTTPGSGTSGNAGNYYLADDISVSSNQHYPNAIEVNIDLNGYNITASGERLFRLRNDSNNTVDYAVTLGIKNSRNGNGKGVISSTKQGAQEGYLIWMTQASQVVNLYSAVLDGRNATTVDSKSGGCVAMYGGTFNMYGGELKGGNATSNGGNIAVSDSDAVFNLYGGTVTGGHAVNGGNITIASGATVNLYGGTVTGGNATKTGGNINVSGTLNLKGATVEKGTATSSGGNMIINSTGKLVMTKGLVTGGNAAGDTVKDHENIHCKFGAVELSGGQIDGYLFIQNFEASQSTIKISGDPKVTGAAKNLVLGWSKDAGDTFEPLYPVIQLGELTEGAKIGITSAGTLIAKGSGTVLTNAKQYLSSDAASKQIVQTAEGLAFADAGKIMGCVCGGKAVGVGDHKCVDVEWTEWDSTAWPNESGNYILTKGISAGQYTLSNGMVMNFDLNGKNIAATSSRVAIVKDANVVLGITDTSATPGSVIGKGTDAQGGTMIVSQGATLNIYAGTITSDFTNAGGVPNGGGVLYTNSDATNPKAHINMYGGKIVNGKTTGHGGNVYIRTGGVMTIYKGEVSGGEALTSGKSGGNFYITEGGQLIMHDGVISGGKSANKGGNVMVIGQDNEAKFVMHGGSIIGGEAISGGSICVNALNGGTSVFEMNGGTITGGNVTSYGAAVYINNPRDTATIIGGTINSGTATLGGPCVYNNGGNLTVDDKATVENIVNK